MAFYFLNGNVSDVVFVCPNCTKGIKKDCPFCVMPRVNINADSVSHNLRPTLVEKIFALGISLALFLFAIDLMLLAVRYRNIELMVGGFAISPIASTVIAESWMVVAHNTYIPSRNVIVDGIAGMFAYAVVFLVMLFTSI